MKREKINTAPVWRLMLLCYGILMLALLFGRANGWVAGLSYSQQLKNNLNLRPLTTIRNYLYVVMHSQNGYLVRHCFVNLVGNVLLFVPLGALLPKVFPRLRKFFPFLLWSLGLILTVETVQLFTLLGSFDVDDIILNMAGLLLGWIPVRLCRKKPR